MNYNYESTKVNKLLFGNKQYDVRDLGKAQLKICELLYEIDKEKFRAMANSEIAIGSTVRYLSFIGDNEKYVKFSNANIYLWTNTSSNQKIDLIKKMLDYFGISHEAVKLSIRGNYNPKPRNIQFKPDIVLTNSSGLKIGKYVKEKMRLLSESGYNFNQATLTAITNKELSHQLMGCNHAFMVSDDDMSNGKAERVRYWKDTFLFNGKQYYITSQWFEYMREQFDKWYKSLKA